MSEWGFIDWRLATVLAILFWGVQRALMKYVLSDNSWPLVTMILYWIGAISATALYFLLDRTTAVRYPLLIVLSGVLMMLAFVFFMFALEYGPASRVVPASSLYVVITTIIAVLFMGESLTLLRWLGVVLGIIAAFLLLS